MRVARRAGTQQAGSVMLDELEDAFYLVPIARAAKQLNPDKPIILSGWHTSLLPDQTLACRRSSCWLRAHRSRRPATDSR